MIFSLDFFVHIGLRLIRQNGGHDELQLGEAGVTSCSGDELFNG